MSFDNIRLLGNRVLIRPEKMEESKGGIILSKTTQLPRGEVLAVGPGVYMPDGKFVETVVKVGDTVMYTEASAQQIEVNDEDVMLVFEHDINGIVS